METRMNMIILVAVVSVSFLTNKAAVAAEIRVEGHEVLIDGEAFVPFGVVDHCKPDEYQRISEYGFNTVAVDGFLRNMEPDGSLDKEIQDLRNDLDVAHKNDLMVLVMLGGAAPPKWLFERYPDCRMKKADGSDEMQFTWTQYSLNHPGIRKELKHYFEGVANGLKHHPALLGWILWNEPYLLLSVDYHPDTIGEFRRWLAEKYSTIDRLNSAWVARFLRFDDVHAPADRSSTSPVAWTDWMVFRQENFADFFEWQARIVRTADPKNLVTTKIRKPLHHSGDTAVQRAVNTIVWADLFCDTVGFDGAPLQDDAHEIRMFPDFMRECPGTNRSGKPKTDSCRPEEEADPRRKPSQARSG